MIKINKEACIGCGLCTADCINGFLKLQDGKALLQREGCNLCGHCVAICPAGAATIEGCPQNLVEYQADTFTVPAENLLHAIQFRRSIRQYQNRPVERQLLAQVLEAGRFMPTGSNLQDVQYTVVQDTLPELRPLIWDGLARYGETAEKDPGLSALEKKVAARLKDLAARHAAGAVGEVLFFQAPVLLVISAAVPTNGHLAAAGIELMANASGLGCLFSGFIERGLKGSPEALELLGLDGSRICNTMLMGYPAVSYRRTAPRKAAAIQWK